MSEFQDNFLSGLDNIQWAGVGVGGNLDNFLSGLDNIQVGQYLS